ncbi:MAG: heme ABC transporter ATP-binding protein [Zhaonellaceae bacterium]|jgi:iron complex transport system ATP-binding protein|nr:heme ABC transporter ATP-binding protein [Clostridia bacterium]
MKDSISVEKLSYYYGPKQILRDISLKITEGSFITFLGPNGSGKTTLLKNICALLTPQKGCVFLNDIALPKIKPQELAKTMAVVPQNTQVNFPFTVLDTVLMGRMPHQKRFQGDSPQDMAIAEWALKLTNTWHLKDRLITELSGGERQRVIVAQALAQQPRIILLDEPTAHLDLQHQLELLELLQKLNKTNGLTVIAILHDLNLAAQYSSYIVLLHQGKIYAAGSPRDVLTPEIIKEVYGIEVSITQSNLDQRFHVIPLAKARSKPKEMKNLRVHLICGGGQGATVMEKLLQEGYQLSCGVLNIGDSDWNKAKSLGLDVVEEAPFTAIRAEVYSNNLKLLEQADVVLVLPTPFGPGNLGNLEQAKLVGEKGKKVILVGTEPITERDFTEGQATAIYHEMLKHHQEVTDLNQVLDILSKESKKAEGDFK